MNGKTIGRTKPEPDRTLVNEAERIRDIVSDALSKGEAYRESEKPTDEERGLRQQVAMLQRRVDQSEARTAVMMNGGDRSNLSRPIGNAFDWMAEFTARVLAADGLTPEAKAEHFAKMVDDVKKLEAQKKRYAADVDLDAADFARRKARGDL
jgi:hypothetical protein